MSPKHDIELMQHADGELDVPQGPQGPQGPEGPDWIDADGKTKVESLRGMSELLRGHLELAADAVPDRRFDAMWREVARSIDVEQPVGLLGRIRSWFERHRGHVFTGMASAGAVAAIAIMLRSDPGDVDAPGSTAIDVQPVSLRPTPVIEDLETPGGNSTVLNLEDDDGHTTVIVVTPADTVEGI